MERGAEVIALSNQVDLEQRVDLLEEQVLQLSALASEQASAANAWRSQVSRWLASEHNHIDTLCTILSALGGLGSITPLPQDPPPSWPTNDL